MNDALGKPLRPPVEEKKEEWKPHPTNPNVLVNTKTGAFKTRDFSLPYIQAEWEDAYAGYEPGLLGWYLD